MVCRRPTQPVPCVPTSSSSPRGHRLKASPPERSYAEKAVRPIARGCPARDSPLGREIAAWLPTLCRLGKLGRLGKPGPGEAGAWGSRGLAKRSEEYTSMKFCYLIVVRRNRAEYQAYASVML